MRIHTLRATLVAAIALAAVGAEAQVNPFKRTGFELTPQDIELLKEAAKKLYIGEAAPVGTIEKWSNPETGNEGTVELVRTFAHKEMPCRRLQHDITISKVSDSYRFVIDRCKVPTGEWKIL